MTTRMTSDQAATAILDGIAPDDLIVEGDLDLADYGSLTSLPLGLNVHGDLDLGGCTHLMSLPPGLSIGGWLDIECCTSLVSLPLGLHVGGDLYLNGCTSLRSLPYDLQVGGGIIGGDHLPREKQPEARFDVVADDEFDDPFAEESES